MPMKKYLNDIFNLDYFGLLMRRFGWLAGVPLAVFAAMVVLCLFLNTNLAFLNFFYIPYAIAAVPGTALLVFKDHTNKNEVSYLLAIPLKRTTIFLTTYVVGLILVLLPLIIITPFLFNGDVSALFAFIILGTFYYNIACLGCFLGNSMWLQLLMMGALAFGPVLLYILLCACIQAVLFGQGMEMYSIFVMGLLPLVSADKYMRDLSWPYWWIHLMIFLLVFGLCFYINRHRSTELSSESGVLKYARNYFLKPLFFLNLVYLIFWICAELTLGGLYYNEAFYFRVIVLLVGTSIMVALLMRLWFDAGNGHFLHFHGFSYCLVMTLLACTLFFIPVYLKERKETKIGTISEMNVSLGNDYEIFNAQQVLSNPNDRYTLMRFIQSHRDHFIKASWQDVNTSFYLDIGILQQDGTYNDQRYYFKAEDFSINDFPFLVEIWQEQREKLLDLLRGDTLYFQDYDGEIYLTEDYCQAIKSTFRDQPSDDYLQKMVVANQDMNIWTIMYRLYLASMTEQSYQEWLKEIKSICPTAVSSEIWDACTALGDLFLEDHDTAGIVWEKNSQHECFDNLLVTGLEWDGSYILSHHDDQLEMRLPISVDVLYDTAITIDHDQWQLFAGDVIILVYHVQFIKDGGQYTMHIGHLEEVIY